MPIASERSSLFLCLCLAFAGTVRAAETEPLPGHSQHGETFNEGPRQFAYVMDGTGAVSFPVTTESEEAQAFFNQGVGQLHGFWYFEAERSFRQVLYLDPTCRMAYWGLAMANVNNEERAAAFIDEARESMDSEKLTERERVYLKALHRYYHGDEKDKKNRLRHLVRDFEAIALDFPEDIEARAFTAYQTWYNSGRGLDITSHLSVDALIQQVLDSNPMHPAHHYKIHLWDQEKAERALPSAARCGQSAPAIAHMWHMPGHTYSRVHRYHDAVYQQSASARVDHAHMMRDRVMPHQIHNYAHNNGWCAENLGFVGEIDAALEMANNLIELPRPAEFKETAGEERYDASGTPFREGRRRLLALLSDYELWEETLRLSETMYLEPTEDPLMQGERLLQRGIALVGLDDVESARGELAAIGALAASWKEKRDAAEDKAKQDADGENADDEKRKQLAEAAKKPFESTIKALQSYEGKLGAYVAVAAGRPVDAREKLEKAKGMDALEKARLYAQLANWEKASEIIRREVGKKENPVVMNAFHVYLLHRLDKKDEAKAAMEDLRPLAATADLQSPPLARLAPIAKEFELPEDWRKPLAAADDLIARPALDDLGSFRWRPTAAPAWTLPQADGSQRSLSDYAGRNVLVIFYLGRSCLHCMEQLNAFAPAVERYREAGVEIVAVSMDSVEGLNATFAGGESNDGTNPFPFPLVSDESREVFKAYRAFDDFEGMALHGTFLVDGEGLVRWQDISYEPFMHPDWLVQESKRLLSMDPTGETVAHRAGQ